MKRGLQLRVDSSRGSRAARGSVFIVPVQPLRVFSRLGPREKGVSQREPRVYGFELEKLLVFRTVRIAENDHVWQTQSRHDFTVEPVLRFGLAPGRNQALVEELARHEVFVQVEGITFCFGRRDQDRRSIHTPLSQFEALSDLHQSRGKTQGCNKADALLEFPG